MDWVLSHGVPWLVFLIFSGLLSMLVHSLRNTLGELKKSIDDLKESNNALALTVSKEYLTRNEFNSDSKQIWDKLDKHSEQIESMSNRVTRIEAKNS